MPLPPVEHSSIASKDVHWRVSSRQSLPGDTKTESFSRPLERRLLGGGREVVEWAVAPSWGMEAFKEEGPALSGATRELVPAFGSARALGAVRGARPKLRGEAEGMGRPGPAMEERASDELEAVLGGGRLAPLAMLWGWGSIGVSRKCETGIKKEERR